MNPLATVEQLADRVGEEITETEDIALANVMLAAASAQARHHGFSGWTKVGLPEVVQFVVLEAAARGYLNPAGYSMERGDMLTLERGREYTSGVAFTPTEIVLVSGVGQRGGIISVTLIRPDILTDQVVIGGDGGGSTLGYR